MRGRRGGSDKFKPKDVHLRTFVDSDGYFCLTNGTHTKRLHRLAYELMVGPIPDGFDIHHRDGDKLNNAPANLEAIEMRAHRRLHAQNRKAEREAAEEAQKPAACE
jgi:hypothetical protein